MNILILQKRLVLIIIMEKLAEKLKEAFDLPNVDDDTILKATKGTCIRAFTELGIAVEDLKGVLFVYFREVYITLRKRIGLENRM